MKKIILTVVVAALAVCTAYSQPRAVGGHIANVVGAEYQHTLGNNFIQVDLDIPDLMASGSHFPGLIAGAQYNWMILHPAWTNKGEWDFYAGAGLATGFVCDQWSDKKLREYDAFYMGFTCQAGLAYSFWFPLMLSLDFKPRIGWAFGADNCFYDKWTYIFIPTFGIKYRF